MGDDTVQTANVNAEFKSAGTDYTDKLALEHFFLDTSTILRCVAAAIGHYSVHDFGAIESCKFVLDRCRQDLTVLSNPAEANDPDTSQDELAEECDYLREASFGRKFGESSYLGNDPRFKVPWVWQGSTERVLVMEYVDGVSVGGSMIDSLSQQDRNDV